MAELTPIAVTVQSEPTSVCDGEVDALLKALKNVATDFRYETNSARLGMAANWNASIGHAAESWLLLLGQDDAVLPPRLVEELATLLPRTPRSIGLVGHRRELVEHGATPLRTRIARRLLDRNRLLPPYEIDVTPEVAIRLGLRLGNIFGEPSCLFIRHEVFEELGGFDPTFDHAADFEFILRAFSHGFGTRLVPDAISIRRRHDSGITNHNVRLGVAAGERQRVFDQYKKHVSPAQRPPLHAAQFLFSINDVVVGARYANANLLKTALRSAMSHFAAAPRACLVRCFSVLFGSRSDVQFIRDHARRQR